MIVKRKWACLSCQKIFDNYAARTGFHSNWDTLAGGRRISPSKVQLNKSRKKPDDILSGT